MGKSKASSGSSNSGKSMLGGRYYTKEERDKAIQEAIRSAEAGQYKETSQLSGGSAGEAPKKKKYKAKTAGTTNQQPVKVNTAKTLADVAAGKKQRTQSAQESQQEQVPETKFTEEANNGKRRSNNEYQKQKEKKNKTSYLEEANKIGGGAKPEDLPKREMKQSFAPEKTVNEITTAEEDADMDAAWANLEGKQNALANTSEEDRNKLIQDYNKAVEAERTAAAWATDDLGRAAAEDAAKVRDKLEEQIKEINRAQGRDVYTDLADEAKSRDLFEGWAGERVAGDAAALGTALEWFDKASDDMVRAEYDAEHGEGAYDAAIAGKNVNQLTDIGNTLFEASKGWQEQAQQDWASGTEDMSELGKQAAGLGKTAADMTLDMIENFIIPGAGRVAMAGRVAGGGALTQDARENNDIDTRMAKAAFDGATAFLSEYLMGGAEAVYGKSVLGGKITETLGKGISNPYLRKALLNTEGLEEGLEYVLGYAGDKILGFDQNGEFSRDELKQNMLVGYIMGVLFNGLAGGINYDAAKLKAVADEAITAAQSGITLEEAAQQAMMEPDENVKITTKEESELGPEIQRVEQTPEGEPSSTITVPLTETPPMQISSNPVIADIQERMTITPKEAAQIRNNPELRAAFEDAYKVTLKGLGEKKAVETITNAVKQQGISERALQQFGEVPEAIPSFGANEDGSISKGQRDYENAMAKQQEVNALVESALSGGKLSKKDAGRITSDPAMWAAFGDALGVETVDDNGKNRIAPTAKNAQDLLQEAQRNNANVKAEQTAEPTQKTAANTEAPETEMNPEGNDTTGTNSEAETQQTAEEQQQNDGNPNTEETAEPNPNQKQDQKRKTDHTKKVEGPDENTDESFDKLNEEHGSIEKGENPARDINVPKKDTKGNKVGEGARTVFEADATPEERVASLKAAVVNGNFGHVPVGNDVRSKGAAAKLAKDGWAKSVADFRAAVESGRADADMIALGAHLINEAGNSTECSGKTYIDLVMAYNDAVSDAGSRLAAGRILKTLTPEGKLYGIEKTVEKMNSEIRKNNEKRGPKRQKAEIKLNEDLVEEYLNAKTEEERNEIHDKIIKDTADQVPNTFRDKFTALRYLNMLGNFKTQVRNLAGNTGMTIVQKAKNEMRGGIEGLVKAATGGKYDQQYKGGIGLAKRLKVASNDFLSDADLQAVAMGEKKFSDIAKQSESEIMDAKKPFSDKNPVGKFLNLYNDLTGKAMELGDLIFVRANYADALAGYMNAHGITEADWNAMVADPEKSAEVDKARAFAIKQAQEATFRDTNAVSKFASTFDSRWPNLAKKAAQGVIPFRKTPANVLVRMEEYSPLGMANTIAKAVQAKKGTAEVSEVIDSASKSLTGSGLAYLGYLLASMGRARTKDDDKNEEALAKLRGQQDYSVEVGGKSLTMDWLSPASAPFFMGVEAYNLSRDGDLKPADFFNVAMSLTNPMLEMSMLSGVNDALSNLNDFEGDNSAMMQFVLNSAWSYLTQGVSNTLLGQVEQFTEKNRQTYYTNSDNPLLPTWAQKKISKLSNKTPIGKDYQTADYIDAWGRKQANDPNLAERAWNVFLNPGYVSKLDEKATKADSVIESLYQYGKEQKDHDSFPSVVPKTPSRTTTVNGVKLTPEEYDEYATIKGQESLKNVVDFIESDQFKKMDEYQQAETISEIYSYSAFLAASKIAESRGETYYDETFTPLLTGQKEDGENTYKAPIKADDIPEYLGYMNAYNDAVNKEDYDALDALIDSSKSLPKSARVGVTQHAQNMEKLADMKEVGLSDVKTYYQFQDDMRQIYESEKRSDAKATDYIRVAGSGKYSAKDADAIMGYERKVSEQSIARYQERVKYSLDKVGKSGLYNTAWSNIEKCAEGKMTTEQFNAWVDKNVPLKYRQNIKDVRSTYASDKHVAGKQVSGIYRAVREAGYTPEQALQFFNMIDKNYNDSYTKHEINAAVAKAFGYDSKYNKKYYGKTYTYYNFSGYAKKVRDGITKYAGK